MKMYQTSVRSSELISAYREEGKKKKNHQKLQQKGKTNLNPTAPFQDPVFWRSL